MLLFWTDESRRTIEVADYKGRYRKTIIETGLILPRGIATDPSTGYVVSKTCSGIHMEIHQCVSRGEILLCVDSF